MTMTSKDLIADLRSRGLIAQITREDAFDAYLSEEPRTLYCGFDPTADSLHIGSLVPLLTLKRFQQAGHKPIALVGGATGLIGDPSFKSQERKLNTPDIVDQWVDRLKVQVSQFIDFDKGDSSASVVNNLDWTKDLNVLDFLRDVGKHFSVSNMINKESVKQRIDREGEGISFTEFTYMLLQSYDFSELYRRHNCTLQIGGSDQWGNITGGVELARRQHGAQAFGLTLPLVTKSDGTKFGKTESGTIWLDPKKTSPYAFYQFWINSADADVYKFLRYFSFLDVAEIDAIEEADKAASGRPQAQMILAEEVTRLVHGEESLQAAQRITEALFSGGMDSLSVSDMEQLQQDGLPCTSLEGVSLSDEMLTGLFVSSGLAKNGKQVKDALSKNAVFVNGQPISAESNMCVDEVFALTNARYGRFFVVRLGKKSYHLFVL
ncbi:tyrosine--tRNA ligase [Eionea flava]